MKSLHDNQEKFDELTPDYISFDFEKTETCKLMLRHDQASTNAPYALLNKIIHKKKFCYYSPEIIHQVFEQLKQNNQDRSKKTDYSKTGVFGPRTAPPVQEMSYTVQNIVPKQKSFIQKLFGGCIEPPTPRSQKPLTKNHYEDIFEQIRNLEYSGVKNDSFVLGLIILEIG